jgi:hypothetical protein
VFFLVLIGTLAVAAAVHLVVIPQQVDLVELAVVAQQKQVVKMVHQV